jgi:small subunit ribosomal protein S2
MVEKKEKTSKENTELENEGKSGESSDLEIAAKAESEITEEPVKDLESKKKALLEKAKKLLSKVDIAETEKLKEEVKGKKKGPTLLPLDDYVKSGIYLGTRVVTPDMRKYVYRRRADGLAILNTDIIDEKIKEGVEYLSKFEPNQIIVVCKRQAGWKAVEKFSQLTGIRCFTKKYPAGILTNTSLPDLKLT